MSHFIKPIDPRVLKRGMADTARHSRIALPVISLFELIMIIRWFLTKKDFANPGHLLYLAGYAVLLCGSLITLAWIRHLGKDTEKNSRGIYHLQAAYAVLIVLWATEISYVGSHYDGFFDYLVYMTIVIIVPVFCFLSPLHWVPIQLASSVMMYHFAAPYPGFSAFLINFTVFTIISILAFATLFRTRCASYQKQLQLEEERDQSRYHALHDALTGLPNRRSYIEDLAKAGTKDLILAMFDVNGLKQVNDSHGHEAGDELLTGAAQCLVSAFSGMGTVYRVGGDEFTGIFYGTAAQLAEALARYHTAERGWRGAQGADLSVSIGMASAAEHPSAAINELEIMADDAMYASKHAYHGKHGK